MYTMAYFRGVLFVILLHSSRVLGTNIGDIGNPVAPTNCLDVNTKVALLTKDVETLKQSIKEKTTTDSDQKVEIALLKNQLKTVSLLFTQYKTSQNELATKVAALTNELSDAVEEIKLIKENADKQKKETDILKGVYTGSNDEKWTMVLKASRGNGQSIFDLWNGVMYTQNPTPAHLEPNSLCACHYKSHLVEKWGSLPIKKVSLILYKDNEPMLNLLFNGEHTSKLNWFSQDRLLSSPWNDLNKTTPSNIQYFSTEGHAEVYRRWFINYKYHGCPDDMGWLTVHDGPREDCQWEKGAPWPTFLYSPLVGKMNYEKNLAGIGRADVMAIYVQM